MPPEQTVNPLVQLLPGIVIFLIFYVLVFKPQKDEQKKKKEMLSNLKKNDEVVTMGGIHGVVILLKDKTVVIRVDDNVKIEFDKDAVTAIEKAKS